MQEYSMLERLPLRSQTETLAQDGIVLAQRHYNGWLITLYTLNNAFVELWSGNRVEVISTFKKSANAVAVLEPYLESMDVAAFINADQ